MSRKPLVLAWLGMGLFLAVVSMPVAAGPPSVDTKAQADTQLYVRTVPDGAKVAVDGQGIGDSPQLFVVPPEVNRMTVEVELPGHEKQSRVVEIRGGRITRVEFALQKASPPRAVTGGQAAEPPHGPARTRYFVRLVVGRDAMTFEGQKTTWEELPALLEGIPNRAQTVLEIAVASDEMTPNDRKDAVEQGGRLARQFGFEYPSYIGVQAIGSKGTPTKALQSTTPPQDTLRTRYFVRLVVGKDAMTFEGQKTTWEEMPALLERTPNRAQTVLEIAVESEEWTPESEGVTPEAVQRGGRLARQFGFEYSSDIGVQAIGSKGSPAQTLPATKESGMLRAELERLLADELARTGQRGQAGPEGQDLAGHVRATIDELLQADPELLQVTAAQEQDFAAGRFDAVGAARRIDATLAICKGDVETPGLYSYLFAEFKGDRLHGARLELAARIVQLPLKRILVVLGRGKDARASRLEFRVAPVREGDAKLKLSPEEIMAYMAVLASEGPDAGFRRDDPVVWFPLRGEPSPGLITLEYGGGHYVLLSNRPAEVMSTSPTRGTPWGLKHVSAVQDDRGQPAVSVELDANGAERIARLTEEYTGSPLAIVVDNQVLSAPAIRSRVHEKVMITGRFSKEEADQLVRGLQAGMVRPEQAPEKGAD